MAPEVECSGPPPRGTQAGLQRPSTLQAVYGQTVWGLMLPTSTPCPSQRCSQKVMNAPDIPHLPRSRGLQGGPARPHSQTPSPAPAGTSHSRSPRVPSKGPKMMKENALTGHMTQPRFRRNRVANSSRNKLKRRPLALTRWTRVGAKKTQKSHFLCSSIRINTSCK